MLSIERQVAIVPNGTSGVTPRARHVLGKRIGGTCAPRGLRDFPRRRIMCLSTCCEAMISRNCPRVPDFRCTASSEHRREVPTRGSSVNPCKARLTLYKCASECADHAKRCRLSRVCALTLAHMRCAFVFLPRNLRSRWTGLSKRALVPRPASRFLPLVSGSLSRWWQAPQREPDW